MDYEVKLEVFQGPLDLLLYLSRKNEIDIADIPIALITRQYLEHLEMMKSLNLDLAGEYLVLAATLIHIKSRMLLPEENEGEAVEGEGEDPRQELVAQLREYQAFKEAALALERRPLLERDVFKRGARIEDAVAAGGAVEEEEMEMDLFDLVAAFQRLLARLGPSGPMTVNRELLSLKRCMETIMDNLRQRGGMAFDDLFPDGRDRRKVIYTFLALLELVKMGAVKAFQTTPFGPIRVVLSGGADHG